MSVSEYEAFASWWKDNSASEVVTSSVDSMMDAFAAHMERVRLATNGISSDIEQITANATSDVEKTQKLIGNISAVQGVLSSQTTGISMSLDDNNSEDLKEYAAALEYANGALQLNSEKVSELVKLKADEQIAYNNTQKALVQSKYLKNAAEIERLRRELSQYGNIENESTKSILEKISAFQTENDTLKGICTSYDLVTASLMEATSAYQHWINAQDASQTGDMFDSAMTAMDLINKAINDSKSEYYQRFNNENYKAAVGLMVPDNIDSTDEAAINAYLQKVNSLLTVDGSGKTTVNFANFVEKAVNAGLMVFDKASNEYKVVAGKTMEDFANELLGNGDKLTADVTQALFGEMQEFGDFFDWADEANKTLGDLGVAATVAAENIRSIEGNESLKLNLDVSDIEGKENKINVLKDTIKEMQSFKNTKLNVDPSQVEYANQIIQYCVAQMQMLEDPAILDVDTSKLSKSAAEAVALVQDFKTAYNELEMQKTLGLDTTEAQAKVDNLRDQISSSDNAYLVSLKLDSSSVEALNSTITELQMPEIQTVFGIDDSALLSYEAENKEALVIYGVDHSAVDAYSPRNLHRTVYYTYKTTNSPPSGGGAGANGTAHASGTAYAGGNWGNPVGGKKLVGEVGPEIVVNTHTGRWYTVGDNGAEFRNIPRGAIVFNHKQTESLLKYGYVSGRGTALASGTAMVTGGISSGAINKLPGSSYKSPASSASSSTSSSSLKNELEAVDLIEIAISRIKRAVNKLTDVVSNAFKSFRTKMNATSDAITMAQEELSIQTRAYDRYMAEAGSVALSGSIKELIQNGAIDIAKYDEETQKLIQDYQKWYEKALECSDAMSELHNTLAELSQQKFDNYAKDYSNQIEQTTYAANTITSKIDALKAKGYMESINLYKSLMDIEQEKVNKLQEEYNDLNNALNEAMASGEIEKYSDAWYEMSNQILDVKEELDKANISLIEYQNTMREIEWGYFDYTQERIAQLTKEADFLVDMLSGTDLYNDNGQLSDTGLATVGVHGMNYNTYMAQADQYAAEIKKINADIAKDPNNTKLIARKEELLDLQRESISAAQKEKQAIVDMVKNGIDLQLDSMQNLIDKYNEALDSAKDFNTYQKQIRDQTSEISNLNKQLTAYTNDDSEETRATLQKLQVELQKAQENLDDTEYQQYITDQKKLLDEIYSEYEVTLNERLDNIDALVEDMIDSVNTNADAINETLHEIAEKNGYELSDNMNSVWTSATSTLNNTLSVYGDDFSEKLTGIGTVLEGIQENTSAMAGNSNSDKYLNNDIPAFASGGLAKFTGLAHLDGTPSKPELVLNPDDTQNFLAIIEAFKKMQGGDLLVGSSLPYSVPEYSYSNRVTDFTPQLSQIMDQIKSNVTNQSQANTFGDINIQIDHVQDYNDFVTQLQHDDEFEKMIRAMTIDRVMGKGPFEKYRYNFKR
ncbi:MAG: hypothetical protein ACI4TK_14485 [Agathobacter sp.]